VVAIPVTLKAINGELEKRGYSARIAKAAGYFYFEGGEADNWLDRVRVPTISGRTLPEWIAEFKRLEKLNAEIMGGKSNKTAPKRKHTKPR
jgi:hypothetical protein